MKERTINTFMSGQLYLVTTPIGNLEDITLRALRILKEVDYIACEDTRHTVKLLNHFEIRKPLVSYHEHNKIEKGPKLIQDLLQGQNIALVTDAGTPAISDPGENLVKLAIESGVSYTSVPGPVALITSLILSGKDTRRFCFEGFLPTQKKDKVRILELLKKETRTIILYESPHRLKKTLNELYKELGDRQITITRELTKKFEEKLCTTFSEAINYYLGTEPRGEYVLIIEGIDINEIEEEEIQKWLNMSYEEHMDYYLNQNVSRKEAVKLIAKDRNLPKREVYNYFNK